MSIRTSNPCGETSSSAMTPLSQQVMIGAMAKEPKAFKVLCCDCAGRGCAAAVLAGANVLARRAESMERGQAERLMPLIAETLKEAGLAPGELDLIAVTTGARGLALATAIPPPGLSNCAAAAAAVPPQVREGRVLVAAIESKREEFYLQAFAASGEALGAGALVHPRDLEAFLPAGKLLLTGDAAARLLPRLKHRDAEIAAGSGPPHPAAVARLGLAIWQKGEAAPPRPLYLRAPDTTSPRAEDPRRQGGNLKPEPPRPRDVAPGDVEALARLHALAFPFEPWDRNSLASLVALPAMRARVIESGGHAPAGFLLALVVAGEAQILTLYVAPDGRRRGVARALLADLAALAREAKAPRLVLEVAADNGPALKLYASCGFAPIRRRGGYYRRGDAPPVDAVMLAREF